MHLLSATVVSGLPNFLVSTGDTIWVSTFADPGVRALDASSGQLGGAITTPTRASTWPSVGTTPGVLWILVRLEAGGSRLTHLLVQRVPGRLVRRPAGLGFSSRRLARDSVIFPRMTRIVGATSSALWLLSHTAAGYTLWRRDLHIATVRRYALASYGSPGVATDADRVYVLLQVRSPRGVILQTRMTDGRLLATSGVISTQGTFEPSPLAACDGDVFGWTRTALGAALFELHASAGVPRYSRRLPPLTRPSKLTAIAPGRNCRNVWVSTVSGATGIVSRLRGSTLAVTRQIDAPYIRALLWARGTLWASDLAHQAVLRLR
jgi:hypothetical protein